jgi:hypothetical protein
MTRTEINIRANRYSELPASGRGSCQLSGIKRPAIAGRYSSGKIVSALDTLEISMDEEKPERGRQGRRASIETGRRRCVE